MQPDFFDEILNSKCSIWKKGGSGTVDGYGIETQMFTLLKADVPCRVEPKGGKELVSDVAFGLQAFRFYMRPQKVDNPPVPLNIHHWLQINFAGAEALIDPPDPNGIMYDIKNVNNPDLLGHHLEIDAELLEP